MAGGIEPKAVSFLLPRSAYCQQGTRRLTIIVAVAKLRLDPPAI